MTGAGKRHRRALGALALLTLLLVMAALVLPIAVSHMPRLQARLVTAVTQRLGGSMRFETLHVSLLPLPHVRLDRTVLSVPSSVQGTIEAVSAYPKLLPLVRGRIELSQVRVAGADLRIQLPQQPTGGNTLPGTTTPTAFKNALDAALAAAALRAPGLAVSITRTNVSLNADEHQDLRLTNVHGRVVLPPDQLYLDLACGSNRWEELSVSAVLNPATFEGGGQLTLARLRLRSVASALLPAGTAVDDATMDVGLRIQLHGFEHVHADVEASAPALEVQRNGTTTRIAGLRLGATWQLDGDTTRVTLPQLQLNSPPVELSGSLVLAPGGAQLEVQATDLDLVALRPVAALVSDHVPVLSEIFEVLQAGHIPRLAFHSAASSLKDLAGVDVLVLDGRLVDGRINVPGIALALGDVSGDVKIVKGMLFGERVSARLDSSRATGGTLRIGLSDPHELTIDTQVNADGAELAVVLQRLVKNERFQREAARIVDVTGTVSGTLRIGGTAGDVTVTAEARSFSISGRVDGTWLPIRVQGGRFLYAADGAIEAGDLLVAVGASTVSQATFRIGPRTDGDFTAAAGPSHIILDEAYPWLLVTGWLPDASGRPASLAGTVSLSAMTTRGTVAARGPWKVQASGAAHALEIGSPELHERVPIHFPISLAKFRLAYDTNTGTSFAADLAAAEGVTGRIDFAWGAEQFNLKQLRLRDAQSDATLTLRATSTERSIAFKGNLADATLRAISEQDLFGGTIRGDFRTTLLLDEPAHSTLEGNLEVNGLTLPLRSDRHLRVAHFTVNAANDTATVDGTVDGDWGSLVQLQGVIRRSPRAFMTDLSVTAGHLDWARIEPWLRRSTNPDDQRMAAAGNRRWQGTVRVNAETFAYRGFTWQPAHAVVVLGSTAITITVADATVCGNIVTPGTLTITPEGIALASQPMAKGAPIEALMKCVGFEKQLATGEYALQAHLNARGQAADLARSLSGHAEFNAKSGRIYGMSLTAKVLSVVSVATGGWESLADTTKEGLPYKTISAKADIKGETIEFTEATLDGPSVKWVGQGSVNLATRTLNITLLVAPLPRVDSVVGRVPLIGGVLGGSLVTIPVRVTGPLGEPEIIPLPPSAVGEGLLRVMKRTLSLPITVLQPLLPATGK